MSYKLSIINSNDFISLLASFINNKDMWGGKINTLISSSMTSLIYMRNKKELILNIDTIRAHLKLNNLIKTFETRTDLPNHIRMGLRSYLTSLPTYNQNIKKQNNTVEEQHSYIEASFSNTLVFLKKIETNNIIMFDKNWVSPDLFFYDEKINIKHKYLNIDNIKTSWIFNPTFIDIIEHLNSINDLGIVTIFDLILSCSKIIKLNKISNIDIFIQNLITDFDSIDKISLQIQKID